MLVVVGEHSAVAVAQPQAGGLFPGGAEPDRLSQPDMAETDDKRDIPPPFCTACSCAVSPAMISFAPFVSARAIRSARSGPGIIDASSITSSVHGRMGAGPRAPRRPGLRAARCRCAARRARRWHVRSGRPRAARGPSAQAAASRVMRYAPCADACAVIRSSMCSCAAVAKRMPPCRRFHPDEIRRAQHGCGLDREGLRQVVGHDKT
nr:hypothetical protein [Trebonia kvetii]